MIYRQQKPKTSIMQNTGKPTTQSGSGLLLTGAAIGHMLSPDHTSNEVLNNNSHNGSCAALRRDFQSCIRNDGLSESCRTQYNTWNECLKTSILARL